MLNSLDTDKDLVCHFQQKPTVLTRVAGFSHLVRTTIFCQVAGSRFTWTILLKMLLSSSPFWVLNAGKWLLGNNQRNAVYNIPLDLKN